MFYAIEEDPNTLLMKALMNAQDDVMRDQTKTAVEAVKVKPQRKNKKKTDPLYKMVHRELLTRPLCRRLHNPNTKDPWAIPKAALKAKMTDRLDFLALPRRGHVLCEKCYSENRLDELPKNNTNKDNPKISLRLNLLATPKPYDDFIKEENVERKSFKTDKEWLDHKARLKTLAAARKSPPSSPEPIREKRPLNTLIMHLRHLAIPAYRPPNNNEKTYEEIYTIKPSNLKYIASDRIQKLSRPKPLNETTLMDINYDPHDKLLAAKKYKGPSNRYSLNVIQLL